MKPLMAGSSYSPSSPSSLSSCLIILLLFLSSSVSVVSKPLESTFLDDLFSLSEELRPLVQANGSEGSAEAVTSSRDQRDLSKELDPLNAMERGAEPGHIWPRLLLDMMSHQNKFRGRTKKNIRENCMGNMLEHPEEGGRC